MMKLIGICKETGDLTEEGMTYCNIGVVYKSMGQYEKAMEYYMKCLHILKGTGNLAEEGKACCNIGNVYQSLGQYKKAMEYYMKHLRISEETGDLEEEGTACCRIGYLYERLGKYEKAMEYFVKCSGIFKETVDLVEEGNAYGNIGNVYESLGQYEKAMEYYMKCLYIFEETGNRAEEGKACCNIGNVYQSLGEYEKAMEYYLKDLRISEETGDLQGQGKVYGNIGNVYRRLDQYEEAMEYFMKCLRIFKGTGNLVDEGKTYLNIGNVNEHLGQNEKAMEYYMKCLCICKDTGDLAEEGNVYHNIGCMYASLRQYDKAMEYYMKCLRIFKDTGDLKGEGKAYGNIGIVYRSLNQHEQAMKYLMKCLSIFKETGDSAGEGKPVYHNIGYLYEHLGQYEKAMEYFMEYLRICRETGDLAGEGEAYLGISTVYWNLGQYDKAMEYLVKDLRICKRTGNLGGEGTVYGHIGTVYHKLGQFEKAMEYYMKSLPIFKENNNLDEEGRTYLSIGNMYTFLGQYEKAMEYSMKCLRIFKKTGSLKEEGKAYCNIGTVYEHLGQYEKAMECLMKGLSICEETGDLRDRGCCYFRIGTTCSSNGDIHRAESSFKESLRCFQELFKSLHNQDDHKVSIVDTYIEVYHCLRHVLIASGKEEEALLVSERGRSQALRDKLIMLYGLPKEEEMSEIPHEDINSLITSSDSSFLFFSFYRTVSIFVIEKGKELCLREKSPGSFAFCANSGIPSKNFTNVVKSYVNKILQDATQHLEAKYRHACEDRSMNQDQDSYPDQQLALDDAISADDLESVATTREEALEDNVTTCVSSYSKVPTDQRDQNSPSSEPLSKQVQPSQLVVDTTTPEGKHELHDELAPPSSTKVPKEEDGAFSETSTVANQRNDDQNGNTAFENLYQALIAPVEDALTKSEIVIIPDGPLFFVPFAALKDKSGTFLSERKRIRLGPSLTTLKLLKECPAEKHCKEGALIVGGPEVGEVKYRGKRKRFGDLPYARQEADMVGEILGVKALTGPLATKDEFKRRLQERVAIIHIATHGNATTGELVFAPGPSAAKKIPREKYYMLTVEEIYSSGINAQLVVLSCCHSGRGKIRREGVVGLTRAFLAAGARSVVASLWAVDDYITLYFMESFYQHLKSGESASASLQQAMKEMRKKPKWSHPYYWASFFLVGDDIRITT